MRVIVVGASLSGMAVGLALEGAGHEVVVLERDIDAGLGGAGLGVDPDLLAEVVGHDPRSSPGALPMIASNRHSTAWSLLHGWLATLCGNRKGMRVERGTAIDDVRQDDRSATALAWGRVAAEGDLLLGADGYRSVVRRHVAPARAKARYAGYLLWRGLAEEREMDAGERLPNETPVAVEVFGAYRLAAYYVPGADGSITPGARRVSWGWYDARRNDILKRLGAVSGDEVRHSLWPGVMPEGLADELGSLARRHWNPPWLGAVLSCLERRRFFATPIAEYLPDEIALGRVALVGDAGHVASPMTGSGFRFALLDALSLRDATTSSPEPSTALAAYRRARLVAVRNLVEYGMRWGERYLAEASRAD